MRAMEEDEKYKEDVKETLDGVLPLIRTETEYGHRRTQNTQK